MKSPNFFQFNGSKRPPNYYQEPLSSKECFLPQKHSKSQICFEEQRADRTENSMAMGSSSLGSNSHKRFKPNTKESRSRIASKDTEACIHSNTNTNSNKAYDNISDPIPCENASISTGSKQTQNQDGTGQEQEGESADEEGDIGGCHTPFQETLTNTNFTKTTSTASERAATSSTLTSPIISCAECASNVIQRDLSLGRSNSIDSCDLDNVPTKNPKILKKLQAKNEPLLEEAKKLSLELGFTCVSTSCQSRYSILIFRCPENHKVKSKEFLISKSLSCSKCEKRLNECKEYATSQKGTGIHRHFNK